MTGNLDFLKISRLFVPIIGDHATGTIHADIGNGSTCWKGQTKGPILFMANQAREYGVGMELF